MPSGLFGLFVALVLTASISIGLTLNPGAEGELCVDISIVVSACFGIVSFLLSGKKSVVAAFLSLVLLGVAWGGHSSTRESVGNIRATIGNDVVFVQFKAALVERFKQPDTSDIDLLDKFQNAIEPPRFRAMAEMIQSIGNDVVVPCSGTVTIFIDGDGGEFSVGDVVKGVGWLRGLEEPHNPGEVDFRVRSFRTDHGGNISVAGNLEIVEKSTEVNHFYSVFRRRVCDWVDKNLLNSIANIAPAKIQTLIVAMTTGRELTGYRGLRQNFSTSGLSHFLAISGFNLAILFGAVWVCMEFLHFPWLIRGWFLMTTAFVFLFVVDVETSVLRAGIAGILVGVSVACDRGWRADGMLAVAAIFTLCCDPWAAWNPGFQLSYGAVLALRYGSEPILNLLSIPWKLFPRLSNFIPSSITKSLLTAFSASIAAWLVSTPITESHFGSVSVWAAVASTILAPLAAVITVLASIACLLGGVPLISVVLGYPLAFFSIIFLWLVDCVAILPAVNIRGGLVPWWWSVIELISLAGCWISGVLLIRRICIYLFMFLFAAAMFFPASVVAASPIGWKLRMTTISVGDGSAHVIETPNTCVLFDAGTISRRAGGSQLVVPALKAIGCTKFDAVIISHPHLDHFSALPEIAKAFTIDRIFASELFLQSTNEQSAPVALIENLKNYKLKIEPLVAGNTMNFGGFIWRVLHPKVGYQSRIVNDGSLVFQISPKEIPLGGVGVHTDPCWLTLCGDSQTEAIANILASPYFSPSMVMELPHHGAWTDGVSELVAGLNSCTFIQSTGFRRFSFDRIGSLIQNRVRGVTCRDGALRVTWFETVINERVTHQILLERWAGVDWVEVNCHTYPK